jgi:hypothetical protein
MLAVDRRARAVQPGTVPAEGRTWVFQAVTVTSWGQGWDRQLAVLGTGEPGRPQRPRPDWGGQWLR